jgi:tritrans,polycis-undecaprenyl-diphosphate synthase [geranylgeranyl-diphosphate specific]
MVGARIRHLGIILDGNRRFARELLKKPWEGHRLGLEKAREALSWACEAGIKYITAYVLSFENLLSRPSVELQYILKYLGEECDAILEDKRHVVHRNKVRVRFIGRIGLLPSWLRKKMEAVETKTARYKRHTLNVAVAYGGQQEIVDAVREICKKVLKGVLSPAVLDEKIIAMHLYTNGQPMPDLIIRTGGEKRLSNFLSYQSAYSELVFLDKRWPEITKKDFIQCLEEFGRRKRRFGK